MKSILSLLHSRMKSFFYIQSRIYTDRRKETHIYTGRDREREREREKEGASSIVTSVLDSNERREQARRGTGWQEGGRTSKRDEAGGSRVNVEAAVNETTLRNIESLIKILIEMEITIRARAPLIL
jgi:hypothetical protein